MVETETIVVQAQFTEMMRWLRRGWRPAPVGRTCPECGQAVWLKVWPRGWEVHQCSACAWRQEYRTK